MEDLAVCARDYAALSPVIFGVCFAVIPVFMVLLNPNLKQLAIAAVIGGIGVGVGFFTGWLIEAGVIFLVVATFGMAFPLLC